VCDNYSLSVLKGQKWCFDWQTIQQVQLFIKSVLCDLSALKTFLSEGSYINAYMYFRIKKKNRNMDMEKLYKGERYCYRKQINNKNIFFKYL